MVITGSNVAMSSARFYMQRAEVKKESFLGSGGNLYDFKPKETSKAESVQELSTNTDALTPAQKLHFEILRIVLDTLRSVSERNRQALCDSLGIDSGRNGVWTKVTSESYTYEEYEATAFSTTGIVKTQDGREIEFNAELAMSRSFYSHYEEVLSEDYVLTDPLVINLDVPAADVTDQKFFFDLDMDGNEEEISFLKPGSGFLCLDLNGDGKINDGSELFGTKSGDGFADLAKYDKDGNGWIDEADEVFDKLRIWTKNAEGKDELIALGKAGVGAIFLGKASTEFALKNFQNNMTNGLIRSTGVFLKETGEVGTIQQVDLAM